MMCAQRSLASSQVYPWLLALLLDLVSGCQDRGPKLTSGDPGERRLAALALGQSGGAGALDDLVPVLRGDADLGVRIAAAQALGMLHGPGATAPLLQKAASDDDLQVRLVALTAIGNRRDPAAVPGLIALWRTHRGRDDGVVHIGVEQTLIKAGRPALPVLLDTLRDSSPDVRVWTLSVLTSIGDRTIEAQITRLTRDENDLVRREAKRALSQIIQRPTPQEHPARDAAAPGR